MGTRDQEPFEAVSLEAQGKCDHLRSQQPQMSPERRHPQTQLRSSIPRLDSRYLAARPFARSLAEIWSPRQTKRNAKHRITRPVFLRRLPAFETLNPICANAPPPTYTSSDLASPLKFTAQMPESCHTRNTRSSESVSPRRSSSLLLLRRASVDLPSFSICNN